MVAAMPTAKLLQEAAQPAKKLANGHYKAVLITPGQGSSGFYHEEVLRETGPAAFPKGTLNWIMHPSWDQPNRNPEKLWGKTTEDAHYEDGVGLVADIEVKKHWQEFVDEVAEDVGLSIYAMGESDENGNVTALLPHRTNSVDLVGYAGREGSSLTKAKEMYEHALLAELEQERAGKSPAGKEHEMDPKDIAKAVSDGIAEAFAQIESRQQAAEQARAQEQKDADALQADADSRVGDALAAIESIPETLPAPSREHLLGLVKGGKTDITADIAAEQARVDAISKALTEGAHVDPHAPASGSTTARQRMEALYPRKKG